MLPKLKDTNKFKKEYLKYKREIEKIENSSARERGLSLLNQLTYQSNLIDIEHNITNRSINPKKVRETIEVMSDIRLQIKKLLKDAR
jgi:hypothetical protein